MRSNRSSTGMKLAISGGLLALVTAGVGGAAFASFTASTNAAANTTATGTVSFADISTNGAGQRLSVGATNVAPGDSLQRAVTVTNTGSVDMLNTVTLTSTAATTSLLDSDTTNGLQINIDKCSVAWTESAVPYTYTCSGTTTTVLASTPVIGANKALNNIVATAGTANYLRATLTLPSTAGNTFQGLSSTMDFTFNGQQRTAVAK
jgi:spore coat-associated protein N